MRRITQAAAVLLLAVVGSRAGEVADVRFSGWSSGDDCRDVVGNPGERFGRSYNIWIETWTTPIPNVGVSAWSLGIATEGVTITDFLILQVPPEAFEMTRLADDFGPCAGRSAVLSVVALPSMVTLPAPGRRPVLYIGTGGEFPAGSEATAVRIEFVDGCRAEGIGVVENAVEWNGMTLRPTLEPDCEYRLLGPLCPHPEATLQVIFQTENVGQTPALFAGQVPTPDPTMPGDLSVEPGETEVWAGIVSQFADERAIGGWSLSVACEGDATLTGAGVDGTAADEVPIGLREVGFMKTELVDPERNSQGQGAISVVVLSTQKPVVLDPRGTATVLRLELSGEAGDVAHLEWKDGLVGSHEYTDNLAAVNGVTFPFTCCQELTLRFAPAFRRADSNNDGNVDIADAINTLNKLFLGTGAIPCREAADANDDGQVNISDPIATLGVLFLGAGNIPPPGRVTCGIDPTGDELRCEAQPEGCA